MQGSSDLRTSSKNGPLKREASAENQPLNGTEESTLIDQDDNISVLCKTVNSDEIKPQNDSFDKQSNDMEDLWDFVEPANKTNRSSTKNPQNSRDQHASFASTISSNLISQNTFNFHDRKSSCRQTQIVNNHFREIITDQPPSTVDFPTQAHQTFMRKSSVQLENSEPNLSQTIAKPEQLQHKLQLALSKVNESQSIRESFHDQKRSQMREPLLRAENNQQSAIAKQNWQIIYEVNQTNDHLNLMNGDLVNLSRYSNENSSSRQNEKQNCNDFVDMEFDNYQRLPNDDQKVSASKKEITSSNPYFDKTGSVSSLASIDSVLYDSPSPRQEIEKLQKQVKQKNQQLGFMAFLIVSLIVLILFQGQSPTKDKLVAEGSGENQKLTNSYPEDQSSDKSSIDRQKSIQDNLKKMQYEEHELQNQLKKELDQLQTSIRNMETDIESVNGNIKQDFERLKNEINEVKERQEKNKIDIMNQQKKLGKQTQNGIKKIDVNNDAIKQKLDNNQQDTKEIFEDLRDDVDKKLLEHSSDPSIQHETQKKPDVPMPPSTKCSSAEGDSCFCYGKVIYGEKYEYDSYTSQRKQITDVNDMLKHPYLERDCGDNCMLAYCTPSFFYQGNYEKNQSSDIEFVEGTEKQCFCQEFE